MIKDWQRYKQLENEKNTDAQEERRQLIKRLAMTCRSEDVDKKLEKEGVKKEVDGGGGAATGSAAASSTAGSAQSEQDIENDLMQDEFFKEYIRKKFEEMQNRNLNL